MKMENGKFGDLLMRSNSELRKDRGAIIVKDTEKRYRRTIEDLQDELDRLIDDRDNMLDINPSNTHTIVNPSDFSSGSFVEKDIALGIRIRETEIRLNVAKKRYTELFEASEELTAEVA